MNVIDNFTGEYAFLLNSYIAPISLGNMNFMSGESLYQICRLKDKSISDMFHSVSGEEARRIGEHVTPRDGWDDVKEDILYLITLEKFKQNPSLAEKLKETGNAVIMDEKLGDILMRVRSELNNKHEV